MCVCRVLFSMLIQCVLCNCINVAVVSVFCLSLSLSFPLMVHFHKAKWLLAKALIAILVHSAGFIKRGLDLQRTKPLIESLGRLVPSVTWLYSGRGFFKESLALLNNKNTNNKQTSNIIAKFSFSFTRTRTLFCSVFNNKIGIFYGCFVFSLFVCVFFFKL